MSTNYIKDSFHLQLAGVRDVKQQSVVPLSGAAGRSDVCLRSELRIRLEIALWNVFTHTYAYLHLVIQTHGRVM